MELNLSEKYKPFPTDKVTRKVKSLDAEKALGMGSPKKDKRRMKMDMSVYVDKNPELRSMHRSAKQAIEKKNKEKYRVSMEEQLDDLLYDPLEELWQLHEAEMSVVPRPQLQDEIPSGYGGPNQDASSHPIIKQRNEIDSLIAQGQDPVQAHHSVHGETNPGDPQSKAKLASTLGRIADDGINSGVRVEKGSQSIYARDARYEKEIDQVTQDDLRTPMNQQVPDRDQTPQDQVAEEVDSSEDYDYNEDVTYLQKYGRA